MKILSIDTSCDETSASVTDGVKVLSNILWSQASMHAKYGGVYPSLAKRAHEERIDSIIEKSLAVSHQSLVDIDAVAVTVGPGLAIALEVGIRKAKELALKFNKPLIPINHIEGHLLSPLARPKNIKLQITNDKFNSSTKSHYPQLTTHNSLPTLPAPAIVASGKHTDLILVREIGKYEVLASTLDDALGEALDKAARMLGLGYPGGPILEKFARDGDPKKYSLPIPLIGQENKMVFSYSGLKTAMYKLVEGEKPLTKQKIADLSASFQDVAFKHIERVLNYYLTAHVSPPTTHLLFGGGVSSNIELRKRLRVICKKHGITLLIPYSKKLCTDNAAMIGVAAGFKFQRNEFVTAEMLGSIERLPHWNVSEELLKYTK